MSFCQADLNNLDDMIKRGVLKTTYNGNQVEYRSMSELLSARSLIQSELQAGAPQSRSTLAAYASGL